MHEGPVTEPHVLYNSGVIYYDFQKTISTSLLHRSASRTEHRSRGRSLERLSTDGDFPGDGRRRNSRNSNREVSPKHDALLAWDRRRNSRNSNRSQSEGPSMQDGPWCDWGRTEAGRVYSRSSSRALSRPARSRSRAPSSQSSRTARGSRDGSFDLYEDRLGSTTGSYAGSSPSSDCLMSAPSILHLVEEIDEAEEEVNSAFLARRIISSMDDCDERSIECIARDIDFPIEGTTT